MAGERNLDTLLRGMKPELQDGIFVFCTIAADEDVPVGIRPLLTFREQEATTLVIRREEAERAGLRYQFASHLLTLTVHSSLDGVGFLAVVSARLVDGDISVNAVSAFYASGRRGPRASAGHGRPGVTLVLDISWRLR
ncbi:ACT domain-containing protein [Bradyrhizobium sp. ISRA443]|uniref:ACT domain-containing protein n=1 Tax=unclassified Bradyrhizobium TaxID=2631580 RepID=UPI0032AF83CC